MLVFLLAVPIARARPTSSSEEGASLVTGRASAMESGVPSCATIVSNASLDATYAGVYTNLPNVTRNWTPAPNSVEPVGQSGYPSLAVGEQQLQGAWQSICNTSTFQSTYAAEGASALVWNNLNLNTTTGYFEASYGFEWSVACAVGSPSQAHCQQSILWFVNLATGSVIGPVSSTGSTKLLPIPAPASRNFAGLSSFELELVVAGVSVGTILLVVGAVHRAGRRTPLEESPGSILSTNRGAEPSTDVPVPSVPARVGASSELEVSPTVIPSDDVGSDPLSDVY
jgi:hypothetical protein